MGNPDALNLLQTGYYLCHVKSCKQLLKLKDFSDLSTITRHWKVHIRRDSEPSCSKLMARHNFLKLQSSKPWMNNHDHTIESLASMTDPLERSFSIEGLMNDALIARQEIQFKGKYLLVDVEKLNEILNSGEASAVVHSSESDIQEFIRQ